MKPIRVTLSSFSTHFLWYFISASFIIGINLIKSPIYTDRFSPEHFGYYTSVVIAYTIYSMVFFNWATSSLWRFYLKATEEKNVPELYFTILRLFLFSTIVLAVGATFVYLSTNTPLLKKLILYGGIFFVTTELVNISLIHLKIEAKSAEFNIINSAQTILSFVILLVLTFVWKQGIESFFTSVIISNLIILFWQVRKIYGKRHIVKFSFNSKITANVKEYIKLAAVIHLAYYLLKNSDRYLIQLYKGHSETGIYNQAYNLADISIYSMISIFFAGIVPDFTHLLEFNKENGHFKQNYVKLVLLYLAIFLPACVYFSIFSEEICKLLLKGEFGMHSNILPPVAFSNLFFGLIHFNIIKFQFQKKRKVMYIAYITSIIFNVVLNVILLRYFSFEIAAITTLVSYFLLFGICYYYDMKNYITIDSLMPIGKAGILLLLQVTIHITVKSYWGSLSIPAIIFEGILFSLLYYFFMKKYTSVFN